MTARKLGNFEPYLQMQIDEILKQLNTVIDLLPMDANTIKGRITAGNGDPENLTAANVLTILGIDKRQLAKAWVNFDGVANDNLAGTYVRAGATVTVTCVNHGHAVGHLVYLDFTSGTATDGAFEITAVSENTFTATHGSAGTTSGNVTLRRNVIINNFNVHSIIDTYVGDYVLNFTNNQPNANYVPAFSISGNTNYTAVVKSDSGSGAPSLKTVSALGIKVVGASGSLVDSESVNVVIFGN
jgi:hypothetical protein